METETCLDIVFQSVADVSREIGAQTETDGPTIVTVDGAHCIGGHCLFGRLDGQRSADWRVHPHRSHDALHSVHVQLVGPQPRYRYRHSLYSFIQYTPPFFISPEVFYK